MIECFDELGQVPIKYIKKIYAPVAGSPRRRGGTRGNDKT